MAIERGEASAGRAAARGVKPAGILGSLKDALRAAGRDDATIPEVLADTAAKAPPLGSPARVAAAAAPALVQSATQQIETIALSAAEAARHARTAPAHIRYEKQEDGARHEPEPPTTRVVRGARETPPAAPPATAPKTRLVRGKQSFARDTFAQDPVVGFLVVVGGPGLGAARPIFEGNNTLGRSGQNRIPLDFGDETISAEAQAYIRYDSTDRSFLFVPNLAKTNVVSVNDKRPAGAVELKPMDVMTFGRTQVAFLPFCGPEFDWSEISDAKDE
jgi:hypothetical protein